MHSPTSYIICASPRCGSTLLCEALTNTGIAGIPEEYFGWRDEPIWQQRWGTTTYAEYIAGAIKQGTTPNGVFGTKIMWYQINEFTRKAQQIPGYKILTTHQIMQTVFPNLQYIWVWRRDKVRQAISHAKARQTNIWKVTTDSPVPQPIAKATFSFEQIDYMMHEMKIHDAQWKKYFLKNGISPMEVVYEDLIHTYQETALQALHYLGISVPEQLELAAQKLKRQSDDETEQWVQRYNELKLQRKRYRLLSFANSTITPILQATPLATLISKKRAYINR